MRIIERKLDLIESKLEERFKAPDNLSDEVTDTVMNLIGYQVRSALTRDLPKGEGVDEGPPDDWQTDTVERILEFIDSETSGVGNHVTGPYTARASVSDNISVDSSMLEGWQAEMWEEQAIGEVDMTVEVRFGPTSRKGVHGKGSEDGVLIYPYRIAEGRVSDTYGIDLRYMLSLTRKRGYTDIDKYEYRGGLLGYSEKPNLFVRDWNGLYGGVKETVRHELIHFIDFQLGEKFGDPNIDQLVSVEDVEKMADYSSMSDVPHDLRKDEFWPNLDTFLTRVENEYERYGPIPELAYKIWLGTSDEDMPNEGDRVGDEWDRPRDSMVYEKTDAMKPFTTLKDEARDAWEKAVKVAWKVAREENWLS